MKNWIKGHVYDFNVDYNDTAVDDVLGIDNYLMKKMDSIKCLNLLRKCLLQQGHFLIVIYQM